MFFYELENICMVIVYMCKKHCPFMLSLQKNQFFSLSSHSPFPQFFIRNKNHKRQNFFWEEGWKWGVGGEVLRGNSLKQTYIDGGVHVKRIGTNKGRRGVKNWKFWANLLFEWPQWIKLKELSATSFMFSILFIKNLMQIINVIKATVFSSA